MPVLMVSLKTSPQPGFSKKRSTRPSPSIMTMPNSRGFGTDSRARVATEPFSLVELDQSRQVDVGEDVAGDDEKAVVQLVSGVEHRAGGSERRLLRGVDEMDPQLRPVPEIGPDVARKEPDGDDDLLEAVLAEKADDVLGHRRIGHGEHRLGQVRRQRAEPGAFPAGHYHGLHEVTGSCRAGPGRRSSSARRASGT